MPQPSRLVEHAEILLSCALVGLLGILVVPVSVRLLDLLIALNLGLALVILLLSINIRRAVDFSAFPTVLLFVTMFRLALHVSSTRLILLEGPGFDGVLIRSFGHFVAGENPIVGLVVFAILVVVQFMIISKGSERVAEVAARFHLDAMPIRLMALDSAEGGGRAPDQLAAERAEIQLEADFYGSMDGASRYVRGENMASIIIVMINILGGIAVGSSRGNSSITEIAKATILLTIGDGLVNLIPSLTVSLAMGIVITKTARSSRLATDMMAQMSQEPRVLSLAAGFLSMLLMLFLVGTGTFSFPVLCGAIGLAYMAVRLRRTAIEAEAAPAATPVDPDVDVVGELMDPTLRLVVGDWLQRGASGNGRDLATMLNQLRTEAAQDLGLFIPEIKVALRPGLPPGAYRLQLRGVEVCGGDIPVAHVLTYEEAEGVPLKGHDPRPFAHRATRATWIKDEGAPPGTLTGLQYLASHLREVTRQHADEILGLEELKVILSSLRTHSPAVAEEIGPGRISSTLLHSVLRLLLTEGVSIRNLPGIIQSLCVHHTRLAEEPEALLEAVRVDLGHQITAPLADEARLIPAMILDPELESGIREGVTGGKLALSPERARALLEELTQATEKMRAKSHRPVLAVHGSMRLHLKRLTARYLPDLIIIALAEATRFRIRAIVRVGRTRTTARIRRSTEAS